MDSKPVTIVFYDRDLVSVWYSTSRNIQQCYTPSFRTRQKTAVCTVNVHISVLCNRCYVLLDQILYSDFSTEIKKKSQRIKVGILSCVFDNFPILVEYR